MYPIRWKGFNCSLFPCRLYYRVELEFRWSKMYLSILQWPEFNCNWGAKQVMINKSAKCGRRLGDIIWWSKWRSLAAWMMSTTHNAQCWRWYGIKACKNQDYNCAYTNLKRHRWRSNEQDLGFEFAYLWEEHMQAKFTRHLRMRVLHVNQLRHNQTIWLFE